MPYSTAPFAAAPFATSVAGESVNLAETLTASESLLVQETLNLLSRAAVGDALASDSMLIAALAETFSVSDQLRLVFEALITDETLLQSVVSGTPVVTTALIDALVLQGVATGSVSALAIASDAVALASVLRSIQDAESSDAATLAESLESTVRALESIMSAAIFSDSVQGLAVITVLLPDTAVLTDGGVGQAMRLAVLTDGAAFSVAFQIAGVPYVGIAMNGATRAISEYTNYNFNSLASFNARLYGAGPEGLYRLQGATDAGAPIKAHLRIAMQRLAGGKAVRQSEAYIGFRGNGELQLKVIVADGGVKKSYLYDLEPAPRGAPQPGRFRIGRGLKTVYGGYELSNVGGADFALDVLEVYPLALDRRLP